MDSIVSIGSGFEMFLKAGDEDTICALSTAPGVGGIAVVRVSGSQAVELCKSLCSFLPDKPESHRVYYGFIKSFDGIEILDEVLVTYFAQGRSFTGEDTVEISCHGGQITTATILRELVKSGCRTARRGEFTYRAFMNGRLDLVQAESVLGLIESQSRQSAKVALRQLQGHLSVEFDKIENDLLWILAHLEASIDFSEEGLEVVPPQDLIDRSSSLLGFVERLEKSYGQGRLLREGVQVALIGKPNAGKSSLLNALLLEERAIVTPHAGTTRDLVEGRMSIGGMPVTLVDTAGLRETENEIERLGIERSHQAIEKSDVVFYIVDMSSGNWRSEVHSYVVSRTGSEKFYFLFNKMDLVSNESQLHSEVQTYLRERDVEDRGIFVSAKTREGLDKVESVLKSLVETSDSESSNVVTQARHLELLQKIHSCLATAIGLMKRDSSPEFIAFELQEAIRAVHELLGKEFNEQVIDRIFKEFCLGK